MATIIIRDEKEAATALAELLYSHLDGLLTEEANTPMSEEDGAWEYFNQLLATLVCNPTIFGQLDKSEVDDLTMRAEKLSIERGLSSPNNWMFDYVVPDWAKDEE
jgi:hypothetical protein